MKQYDYLIVGSGLFGSVFAYKARHAGKKVLVLEKRDCLGGTIYCENESHIFHTSNKAVWDFVNSFVPFNRLTLDNNYFDDEYQGIPIGGYNKLIDGLLDGIECRTNTDFFFDRLTLEALAKNIVYTGKLDEFYNYQYGKLEYHTQDGIELSSPKSDNHNRAISAHYRRIAGREPNVIFGGRLAEYKYYNMDELIEKALLMWE